MSSNNRIYRYRQMQCNLAQIKPLRLRINYCLISIQSSRNWIYCVACDRFKQRRSFYCPVELPDGRLKRFWVCSCYPWTVLLCVSKLLVSYFTWKDCSLLTRQLCSINFQNKMYFVIHHANLKVWTDGRWSGECLCNKR